MKNFVALLIVWVAFATAPAFAGYDEGVEAINNNDYATALRELRPSAEQGDAKAQNALGWMYASGLGVLNDYKEAVKWYRLSAKQGDAKAQNNLGDLYERGLGVRQDYTEAIKLYRLASKQGHAEAQFNLSLMYYHGWGGVSQDYVRTHMWANVAGSNGNQRGANLRSVLEAQMSQSQIKKANNLARECVKKNYKGC